MQESGSSHTNDERQKGSGFETFATYLSIFIAIVFFPISWICCLKLSLEWERIVIFRMGRLREGPPRGPGLVWVLPCIDSYEKVDQRTNSFEVPPQQILTRDSVSITLDAVVYYRYFDPLLVLVKVANVKESTEFLAATTLRNIVGTKTLQELLTNKESLSHIIGQILDGATDSWGVKVERVEIKNLRIPLEMQRSLAQEAEALREAKAKIISADGELASSKALKQASDIMSQNRMTLQLRYLQTITFMATEKNSTVVLPFPIDLMTLGEDDDSE